MTIASSVARIRFTGLRLCVDDARSWFARSHESFDLIQMSMIDTWAATGAGAFTLSENGLYTVNGWKRFMARLTPTGVFTVSRWYAPQRLDETARVLSLAMATLIEMGETHPADHIYLAGNGKLSTLVVGRATLTADDVRTLDETVGALQYRTLAAPGRPSADPTFEHILHARTVAELVQFGGASELNLAPTWDSNPFFFNQLRLSDPSSMAWAAIAADGMVHGNLSASLTLLLLVASRCWWSLSSYSVRQDALRDAREGACAALEQLPIFLRSALLSCSSRSASFSACRCFSDIRYMDWRSCCSSVILATGAGSLISERTMRLSPASLAGWPLVLAAYLGTLPLWLGNVLRSR